MHPAARPREKERRGATPLGADLPSSGTLGPRGGIVLRAVIVVLLLALCLGDVAGADAFLPWDGREATDLAEKLRDQVSAAAAAADTSMPQSTQAQHSARRRAREKLASLAASTEELVSQLQRAQGPERTQPTFVQVSEKAALVSRFLEEEKATRKLRILWIDVRASLEQLSRYYPLAAAEGDGSSLR